MSIVFLNICSYNKERQFKRDLMFLSYRMAHLPFWFSATKKGIKFTHVLTGRLLTIVSIFFYLDPLTSKQLHDYNFFCSHFN